MSQVVVVIGGGSLSPRAAAEVTPEDIIVAADSGLDHAVAAGLRPSILVGDLDSISAHGKMWAYAHELDIDEHDVDKDATDTELALARAASTRTPPTCSCSVPSVIDSTTPSAPSLRSAARSWPASRRCGWCSTMPTCTSFTLVMHW